MKYKAHLMVATALLTMAAGSARPAGWPGAPGSMMSPWGSPFSGMPGGFMPWSGSSPFGGNSSFMPWNAWSSGPSGGSSLFPYAGAFPWGGNSNPWSSGWMPWGGSSGWNGWNNLAPWRGDYNRNNRQRDWLETLILMNTLNGLGGNNAVTLPGLSPLPGLTSLPGSPYLPGLQPPAGIDNATPLPPLPVPQPPAYPDPPQAALPARPRSSTNPFMDGWTPAIPGPMIPPPRSFDPFASSAATAGSPDAVQAVPRPAPPTPDIPEERFAPFTGTPRPAPPRPAVPRGFDPFATEHPVQSNRPYPRFPDNPLEP